MHGHGADIITKWHAAAWDIIVSAVLQLSFAGGCMVVCATAWMASWQCFTRKGER